LNNGSNVFCEKSLTLDYETSKELYDIAEKNNCKLYVDDVFIYRDKLEEIKKSIESSNDINVVWKKIGRSDYGKFIMSNLYNLSWHDFYLLYECLGGNVTEIKNINSNDKLEFGFKIDQKQINFLYDRCSSENDHSINDVSLMHDGNDEDAITKMFDYVFSNDDYTDNKSRTLFCAKLIDLLRKELFKNVTVVGGGIFGVTCAWMLSKSGYHVTLYEKGDDIINSVNNSGRPDGFVASSAEGEFKEYQFSIDELEQFTGFQIKIVMSGTNEARAPRFKDLRVIALA
jgi:hypothetical protein